MRASATKRERPATLQRQSLIHSVPLIAALLAIGGIYYFLSAQFPVGPRGLILALIIPLVFILIGAIHRERLVITRTISIVILGVVVLAEAISISALIASIITTSTRVSDVPHATALILLRDAALIWLVNILTFAFWYWELDGGGPSQRLLVGYESTDFIFPQCSLDHSRAREWIPHFIDYLFLAFNTSTAFSPTDTMVLSVRAKILMMAQSLISLSVLAVIIARAINTL